MNVQITCLLFGRVGVVKANDQFPLVHSGEVLVQQRGLGMSDVQVATGLRRESRDDFALLGIL